MATLPTTPPYTHSNFFNSITSIQSPPSIFLLSSSSINHSRSSSPHHHRPFCGPSSNLSRTFSRCHAGIPGPPPENEPNHSKGITRFATTFSKQWDSMRILFAVFFWLSLFFWASATDWKNIDGGNKGNRFRK
ncbi:hypothetical protein vseg_012995 [Gypsophila vaccaria]